MVVGVMAPIVQGRFFREVGVRLHPVEPTDNVRMAQRGLPRIASPEGAQRILTRLQELSEPLGTTIVIENGVG
jgi:poly-gamma-glutamate synthesis protein (capsule biosynthesis protein)